MVRLTLITITFWLFCNNALAKQLWSDASISYLYGSNYEVGDDEKSVMTLEHASGHTWGSTFTFVDRLHDHNLGGNETYGEISANIDLAEFENSWVNKFYVSPQLEFGSNPFNNFNNVLYGVGVRLNVPKAKYVNVTLYRRNNDLIDDNNQVTIVWAFQLTNNIVYDGFTDIVDSNSERDSQYNITSQLKYDIGQHFNISKSTLYLGIEYTYWHNKFGIDGITENNANFLVKWHL
ncbi:nucleoside-binding protein [Thalassotalea sp. PLHSN55]|uniref:nucleoside-binding protein n=1 Tax=Thalassotalea sp. PLHSN55 TaxID=3435888 RepID=UPI003F83A106